MSRFIQAPTLCVSSRFAYSHDPYNEERGTFVEFQMIAPMAPNERLTLHKMLNGMIQHIPFPAERIDVGLPSEDELPYMTQKVFLGQLPFHVTEMELVWLCGIFGVRITCPQRITRRVEGELRPTGGVHVFCRPEDFEVLHQNMHKRVLFDDSGVWFAATLDEKQALDSYVRHLHQNKKLRHAGRPYDSVVVQRAMSTYVPRQIVQFDH